MCRSLRRASPRVAFRLRLRRGYGLPGRHLLGPLADQIRQAGDLTRTPHSILKIGPEVDAESPARLLQACEGVPGLAAQVTSRTSTDLPLLDVVPKMAFAQVVV